MLKLLPILLAAIMSVGCKSKPVETLTSDSSKPVTAPADVNEEKPAEAVAEAKDPEPTEDAPYASTQVSAKDEVVIETNMGTIKLRLFVDKAPNHAKNFVYLAKKGFYDNTKFHRVINGFMIQGGDPNTKPGGEKNGPAGTGGPGYYVKNEFNDTAHVKGILSMARSMDPDSAGSQFFIVHEPAAHLDGKYTAFGRVTSGLDIVDKIANVKTLPGDAPEKPVIIKSIKVNPGK